MQNVHHTAEDGVTAFQGTEAALQERCKDAKLSPAEFQRKLSRCSLTACRGMCCYGGVSVDDHNSRCASTFVNGTSIRFPRDGAGVAGHRRGTDRMARRCRKHHPPQTARVPITG